MGDLGTNNTLHQVFDYFADNLNMKLESLGPFSMNSLMSSEREDAVKAVQSEAGFVRAIPPDAGTPDLTEDETKAGLLRLADYLKKFRGQKKPSEKKKKSRQQIGKALVQYKKVSQSQTDEEQKGLQISLLA